MKPLQLHISLNGTKPIVWRRVLVRSDITFLELHSIIQAVMGWTDTHLFEFNIHGNVITEPDEDFDEDGLSAADETLASWIKPTTKSFRYIYDFGDDWVHTITVEESTTSDLPPKLPVCVAGGGACPPEDCGGVYGYRDLLKQKNSLIDPNVFNLDEANDALLT